MRTFFCTIILSFTIIALSAQDSTKFDTIQLAIYIQEDFQAIVKQLEEVEKAKQDLVGQLILIAKSHGIKPEEIAGFTQDNKSILKRTK